jgi:hypothetical protein
LSLWAFRLASFRIRLASALCGQLLGCGWWQLAPQASGRAFLGIELLIRAQHHAAQRSMYRGVGYMLSLLSLSSMVIEVLIMSAVVARILFD